MATKAFLEQAYLAYFGRPIDPNGVAAFVNATETEVENAFWASPESQALYGSVFGLQQINMVYNMLFGRDAEPAGLAYWANQIVIGNLTPAGAAIGILRGALNDDVIALNNKLAASAAFTAGLDTTDEILGFAGDAAAASARVWLATVTMTPATQEEVDAAIAAAVEAGNNAAGTVFTFTTGVDTLVGTDGNDTFNGISNNQNDLTLANAETFGGLDSVDGGAGNDRLVITNPDGKLELDAGVTVKNVENLSLTSAANNVVADVQAWSGLTNVSIDNRAADKNVYLTSKGNVTTASVKGGFDAFLSDTSTSDALASVSVDGISHHVNIKSDALTALSIKDSDAWVSVEAAVGARELNITLNNANYGLVDNTATSGSITTTGKASDFFVAAAALTTVTLAGDQALTLSASAPLVKTITSTNTAGVHITTPLNDGTAFTGGSGNDQVSISNANTKATAMGAGDDTVNASGTALGIGGTIDGGDGTDTIALSAADAAALSAAVTYEARISNFEKVGLGQVEGGAADVVNLANLDDISYVVSAGTAYESGTAELQTITFGDADVNGGVLTVGGVNVTIPSGAWAGTVGDTVAAQEAAIMAANPNIASVRSDGWGDVTVEYTTTSGNVANIAVAQNASGVTFGAVVPVDGTTLVKEVQAITVGAAPVATGVYTIGGVTMNAVLGETTVQTAARIATDLAANKPAGVENVIYTPGASVVQVQFTAAAGNAADLAIVDLGGVFAADPTVAEVVAYVAPVAETQTVTVTAGTDATGGEVLVGGARIALEGNQSIDQVGATIAGSLLAIQAANPNVASVGYNTATDTLTFGFTLAAGNTANIVVADNSTTGASISVVETQTGIAGSAGGSLNVTNMANGGTLELTSDNGGSTTVTMKDATGAADSLNLVLNGSSGLWVVNGGELNVAGVESINIVATDSNPDSNPTYSSGMELNAAAATSITLSGNHGVYFVGSTAKVTTLDASGVVADVDPTGLTAAQIVAANGQAGAVYFVTEVTDKDVTISTGNGNDMVYAGSVGSLAGSTNSATITTGAGMDFVIGGQDNDTINTGSENDTVIATAGADTITLGAGNDAYELGDATFSVLAKHDTIADFSANTYGNGTNGAAGTGASGDTTKWTGDVIDVSVLLGGLGVDVFVTANAADAQTFIQNTGNNSGTLTGFALDSSSGKLYMDFGSDGVIDSVVMLTGVTTITEAAFVIV